MVVYITAYGRVSVLTVGRLGLVGWLVLTTLSSSLWQFMLADWLTWGVISAATEATENAFFADIFGERPLLSGQIRAKNGVYGGIAGFVSE